MIIPDLSEQVKAYVFGKDEIMVPPGVELVEDADNQLLLDLDSPEGLRTFIRGLPVVDRRWGIDFIDIYQSKGGNIHAIVLLNECTKSLEERIVLQTALGSDPMRSILFCAQDGTANVLFRPILEGDPF